MNGRHLIGAVTFAAVLAMTAAGARAYDDALYPDLSGPWTRISPPGMPAWDPSMPRGRGQKAPLTPEYNAVFEANLAELAAGGEGFWPGYACRPVGMPAMMTAFEPMEVVVTPETTHILIDHIVDSNRRIYTDGRPWPEDVERAFTGYSIGKWVDTDGDGRFDTLEVETRHIKGQRAFDATGIPMHRDNATIVKERIFLDKADRNVLHDEVTTIDHALTRPWTVMKRYQRSAEAEPLWREYICAENNNHVEIGHDSYFISADGYLMPSRKGQPPPDVRYFKQPGK